MKKARRKDFALGIVVIVVMALFVATIVFLIPSYGAKTRHIIVQFRHEDGVAPIAKNSPVMIGGALQVGVVHDIRTALVDSTSPEGLTRELMIIVDADIDESLPLYDDCQISTDQPPVGGVGTVVILSIGVSRKPLIGSGPVNGLPPQSLAAAVGMLSRRLVGPGGLVQNIEEMLDVEHEGSVAAQLSASMNNIQVMTAELRNQFDPRENQALIAKIHALADNLHFLTASLKTQADADDAASAVAQVHRALESVNVGLAQITQMLEENRPVIRSAISHVERVTDAADQQIATRLGREFDRNDPDSLLSKIRADVDRLGNSLADLAVVTDTSRRLVVLNRPLLQRTIENLKETSDRMRVGIQELLLTPWRLLGPPPGGEAKKIDTLEAARRFAEAATALDDAAARLKAASELPESQAATPEEIQEIQDALKSAFERFGEAEKYLYEQMK